jgi:hypothetical protein
VQLLLALPSPAAATVRPRTYDPIAGAPASQRGPNSQTIGIDKADADHGTRAFGGMSDTTSQSGIRLAARDPLSIYSHH